MNITAKMVSELRDKTDAPMLVCKQSLIRTNGNIDEAENLIQARLIPHGFIGESENESLRQQLEKTRLDLISAYGENEELSGQLAECKKDAERYRFNSYAGVIMWIGDKRTMKIATREQVASEVEYGCVIVHTAQHCLDELSALGETK